MPNDTHTTYLDHITAAQTALADLTNHANQHLLAAVAQAHALVAIALLLEEHIDTPDTANNGLVQTVRIVGGWPQHTSH